MKHARYHQICSIQYRNRNTVVNLSNYVTSSAETLQGVLGSGEKGVQNYREQGAWDQKDQGAGSKGK